MVEPIFPAERPPDERRRALAYTMVVLASALFGVNGSVSKSILRHGLAPERLTEMRCAGALAGLALALALTRPHALAVRVGELPFLAGFGIGGLALVQWTYFAAIHRIAIGVALLIQYLAPLLVALWARFVYRERVRRRVWASLAFSLAGLGLIVRIWHGLTLDTVGVLAAFAAALTYALYVLTAERGVARRDAVSLSCWGFLFATLFFSVLDPWWTFPGRTVGETASLGGRLAGVHLPLWAPALWMIVLGTIVPFALVIGALRHLSATRVGIVAMLEPVVAIVVAWAWLRESLAPAQLTGAAVVLAGVVLAETAR